MYEYQFIIFFLEFVLSDCSSEQHLYDRPFVLLLFRGNSGGQVRPEAEPDGLHLLRGERGHERRLLQRIRLLLRH